MLVRKICFHFCVSVIFTIITFSFTSCENASEQEPLTELNRGQLIESEKIGEFPVELISSFFSLSSDIPDFIPLFDVTVYRIVYYTVSPTNEIITASGAIFIPSSINPLPFISVQHGTISKRTEVASVDAYFGYEGIISASLGYYACLPDYLGFGVSEIHHPYHLAKPSATCVIDMIRASKKFAENSNISLNGKIFLAGYSEGGYVTLAAQKEIDMNYHNEINLTAVSAMAGAYDLSGTVTQLFNETHYYMPGYIAFIVSAYNQFYNWNKLNEIFSEPYSGKINRLFDGSKTIPQINAELTINLSELFTSEFISKIKNGSATYILDALAENNLIEWTPITPLLLVHGNADEFVPYQNSVTALNSFNSRGAQHVRLITVEGGTHATSVIPAIMATLEWFGEFGNGNSIAIK